MGRDADITGWAIVNVDAMLISAMMISFEMRMCSEDIGTHLSESSIEFSLFNLAVN